MTDRFAPDGKVWLCAACGKTTKDQYGSEHGWDESCMLNSYLVDEANPRLDMAKVDADRTQRIAELSAQMDEFRQQLRDGTWEPAPELLALAEQIVSEGKDHP